MKNITHPTVTELRKEREHKIEFKKLQIMLEKCRSEYHFERAERLELELKLLLDE